MIAEIIPWDFRIGDRVEFYASSIPIIGRIESTMEDWFFIRSEQPIISGGWWRRGHEMTRIREDWE